MYVIKHEMCEINETSFSKEYVTQLFSSFQQKLGVAYFLSDNIPYLNDRL